MKRQADFRWQYYALAFLGLLSLLNSGTAANAQESPRVDAQAAPANGSAGQGWLALLPSLIVEREYLSASRTIRRAFAADPKTFEYSNTAALRRGISALPSSTREQLASAAVSGVHDGYFLLGASLCFMGDQLQGSAILRLHDLRVGGDPVAAAIGAFPTAFTLPLSARKLVEGRPKAALAAAMSEYSSAPNEKNLGLCVALLISSGEFAGAEQMLANDFQLIPEWPLQDAKSPWNAKEIASALNRLTLGRRFAPLKATPALALGLSVLGHQEVAKALAVEATGSDLSQFARRIWQAVLEAPRLPDGALTPDLKASLDESGVLPTFPGVFEAISQSKPTDAATLLLRMPASLQNEQEFQLARGLCLVLQGRDADALPALTAWLSMAPAGGPLLPRLVPLLPPTMAATLIGPPFRGEGVVRLLMRFALATQANADTSRHLEEIILAGPAYAKLLELMRRVAGSEGSALAESGAILARRSLELGDIAFRNRDYPRAKELYLKAGQQDEATRGLAGALFRGAFATAQWDSASAKLLEMLSALGDPKTKDRDPTTLILGFNTGLAAAYSDTADLLEHRQALAKYADSKKLLEQAWLLWGVVELESGNRDGAKQALDGVIRMGGRLEPWAKVFRAKIQ